MDGRGRWPSATPLSALVTALKATFVRGKSALAASQTGSKAPVAAGRRAREDKGIRSCLQTGTYTKGKHLLVPMIGSVVRILGEVDDEGDRVCLNESSRWHLSSGSIHLSFWDRLAWYLKKSTTKGMEFASGGQSVRQMPKVAVTERRFAIKRRAAHSRNLLKTFRQVQGATNPCNKLISFRLCNPYALNSSACQRGKDSPRGIRDYP